MDGLFIFVVLLLLIGGMIGFLVGRIRAEWGRARFDRHKNWVSRKDYRRS